MNYDINTPKIISKNILRISDTVWIEKSLYEKRGYKFYDIELSLNSNKIFLGRFSKDYNDLDVKYNEGKILICNTKFDFESKKIVIIKVLDLYDMSDDMFYCTTEQEALNIFDSNIDTSYLTNKNKFIVRNDIEKKKKLR